MLRLLTFLCVGSTWGLSLPPLGASEAELQASFEGWMKHFDVDYAGFTEKEKRFQIFKENIERARALTHKSTSGAQFGLSKFSDLSPAEFKTRLGYRKGKMQRKPKKMVKKSATKPADVDWRGKLTTPVKDQGQCGSCWAFSATEQIETGLLMSGAPMEALSPQEIVSCDNVDYGCEGGDPLQAYDYVMQAGGMEPESAYPYKSGDTTRTGSCKLKKSKIDVEMTDYDIVSQDASDEPAMYTQIATSPMSVCVDAESWQMYTGGVVDSSTCYTDVDHCVQVVGYEAASDAWIVRNSWNTDWGEEGYIRVKAGENACAIASETTVVTAQSMKKKTVETPAKNASDDTLEKAFEEFISVYNREYASEEEKKMRFAAFKANIAKIWELTTKSGGKSFYAINKFADIPADEFKKTRKGYIQNKAALDELPMSDILEKTDKSGSVDWRGKLTTPVKDQGQCGSCWAFSATEQMETGLMMGGAPMEELAPQQVVSCDKVDYGCNGGDTPTAYKYVMKAGGIEDEKDYPYTSGDTMITGRCKVSKSKFAVDIMNPKVISKSESGEKKMMAQIQKSPMSICVDAESWQMYSGGVVDSSTCGVEVDHCVQVVGYDASSDAWLVRNSWNTDWGEEGYIRVKYGENACAIASEATIVDAEPEMKNKQTTIETPKLNASALEMEQSFEQFMGVFGRVYASAEEKMARFAAYKANVQKIHRLNAKAKGKSTYAINKFADVPAEEFKKQSKGYIQNKAALEELPMHEPEFVEGARGKSVDWRGKLTTPVKDQGQCGSCWAFSATEQMETGLMLGGAKMEELAPQQVVSCDDVDLGCNGGDTPTAYKYVMQAGGIEDEKDYPYTSGETMNTGKCKVNKSKFAVDIMNPKVVSKKPGQEKKMLQQIQKSPMSICVDAESWQMYSSGIVDASTCGVEVDHCVQVVGYSASDDAWIVRNSWNTNWGEDGYIRVKYGENACAIASEATIVDAEPEMKTTTKITEVKLPAKDASPDNLWRAFMQFMETYEKFYDSEEEKMGRFGIFKENVMKAHKLNDEAEESTYGINKFADIAADEFTRKYKGYKPPTKEALEKVEKVVFAEKLSAPLADDVDWRGKLTTPVKDQGQCGSCWAFSATEQIETGFIMHTGSTEELAPQQIVSCDIGHGDFGCMGGNTLPAYKYAMNAGGMEPEEDYPYVSGETGETGSCKADKADFDVEVMNPKVVSDTAEGESDMMTQMATSPMSICVDAESWQLYTGGVVTAKTCHQSVDHCVQVVGYEAASNAWLVRNSWNTDWGEDGYIRVKYGQNACAIASMATIVDANSEAFDKLKVKLEKRKTNNKKTAAPLSRADWIALVQGITEGLLGTDILEECVVDAKNFATLVEAAIKDFESHDDLKVLEGLKILYSAVLKTFPASLRACRAVESEIQDIVKALTTLTNPATFVYHTGKDMIVNGVQIFKEINAAIGDWKTQNYLGFGKDIGTAVKLIVIGDAKYRYGELTTVKNYSWQDYQKIFLGIGEGLGFKLVKECISDSELFGTLVEDAVHSLEQKTPESVAHGVYDLAFALAKPLPKALQACNATVKSVQMVADALAQMMTPQTFAYHVGKDLAINGISIFRQINAAVGDQKHQQYEDFGEDLGNVLRMLILGRSQEQQIDPYKTVDFTRGFGRGIGIKMMDSCIDQSGAFVVQIKAVVELMKKKDQADMISAFVLLAQTLSEVLPLAMTNCKASAGEVKAIIDVLMQFESPKEFVYHVGEDLLINGKSIFMSINSFIGDKQKDDWEAMGEDMGAVFNELMIGAAPTSTAQQQLRDTPSQQEVEDYMVGFAAGFGITLEDKCISASGDSTEKLSDAMKKLESKNYFVRAQGMVELAEALKALPSDAEDCKATTDDLKNLAKALHIMDNPSEFLEHLAQDATENGLAIGEKFSTSLVEWAANQYKPAGNDMGTAANLLVVGKTNAKAIAWKDTWLGVAKGFQVDLDPDCVDGTADGYDKISAAIKKAMEDKDYVAALQEILAVLMMDQPIVWGKCMQTVQELKEVWVKLSPLQDPEAFAEHVMADLKKYQMNIMMDVLKMQQSFQKEDYANFGEALGEILRFAFNGDAAATASSSIALFSDDEPVSPEDVTDFARGLTHGFGVRLEEQCISDSTDLQASIAKAINLLKNKDTIQEGIMLLVQIFSTMTPKTMTSCQGTVEDLKEVYDKLPKDIQELVDHMIADLKESAPALMMESVTLMTNCSGKMWQPCGEVAGNMLHQIVVGDLTARYFKQKISFANKLTTTEAHDLVKGFSEGMQVTMVDECLDGGDAIALKVADAIKKIQDPSTMQVGIMELIQIFTQDVPGESTSCVDTIADVKDIYAQLAALGLSDFIAQVEKNLMTQGISIFADVAAGQASCQNQLYEACGKSFGTAAHLTLLAESENDLIVV